MNEKISLFLLVLLSKDKKIYFRKIIKIINEDIKTILI